MRTPIDWVSRAQFFSVLISWCTSLRSVWSSLLANKGCAAAPVTVFYDNTGTDACEPTTVVRPVEQARSGHA